MKKKMTLNFKKCTFLAVLLCLLFSCSLPSSAASSDMKRLKTGKTYRVTMTGKGKQKLKLTTFSTANTRFLSIYINDEKMVTLPGMGDDPDYNTWEIALCRIAPGRRILYVRDKGPNDTCTYMKLFEYNSATERFTELGDLVTLSKNHTMYEGPKLLSGWARGHLEGVRDGRLIIEWQDVDMAFGTFFIDVPYEVTGQSVKQYGTSYKLKQNSIAKTRWTSKVNITASTKPGGHNTSFTISRREKVTAQKVRRKNGILYARIKNSEGKTGWIHDLTQGNAINIHGFFEESRFVG
ncbi:hypothetical protein [Parablautia sp. Marseille-Q6255]|uniref:hypothetical protein n=1 Tax=Parablautia sp. Marseille-Q6255 TaxID=3039593 RepID=UPI0024BC4CBD|nr:hypothetical protein [Parablautia sp. Marseille-Q6255]